MFVRGELLLWDYQKEEVVHWIHLQGEMIDEARITTVDVPVGSVLLIHTRNGNAQTLAHALCGTCLVVVDLLERGGRSSAPKAMLATMMQAGGACGPGSQLILEAFQDYSPSLGKGLQGTLKVPQSPFSHDKATLGMCLPLSAHHTESQQVVDRESWGIVG
jgi:hypothetical protein